LQDGAKSTFEENILTNFTNEIRRDLLAYIPSTRSGAAAALAALLATGASLTDEGFEIVSENERVAEFFLRLAEKFGARPKRPLSESARALHEIALRKSKKSCIKKHFKFFFDEVKNDMKKEGFPSFLIVSLCL